MEGVMMRNGGRYAVAVRTADRRITVKTGLYNGVIRNRKIAGIPIIRGMVSFVVPRSSESREKRRKRRRFWRKPGRMPMKSAGS